MAPNNDNDTYSDIGYYSEMQRKRAGTNTYMGPNGPVVITSVSASGVPPPKFPDVVSVGPVGRWLARGAKRAQFIQTKDKPKWTVFRDDNNQLFLVCNNTQMLAYKFFENRYTHIMLSLIHI